MFFHTREWSVNTDKILSVEWNTDLKQAHIFLCDGRSYTLGELDATDFDRLDEALGYSHSNAPDYYHRLVEELGYGPSDAPDYRDSNR